MLAFGAGIGCAAWGRRRTAVTKRKPKACKMLDAAVEPAPSPSRTSSTESFMDRWEKIPRTPFVCGGKITNNPPKSKMPSNTGTTVQPPPDGGTSSEPEEEDAIGRECNPTPGRAGYVAHRTAEFDNKVPFLNMDTEGGLMFNHNDRVSGTDGDVVPEGFVRAYAQEIQNQLAMQGFACTTALGQYWESLDVVPEGVVRAYVQKIQSQLAMHGKGRLAKVPERITWSIVLCQCWGGLVRRCTRWVL